MAETFDLAIVGGGIVGTVAALLAHRSRPDWTLLLLDRSEFGQGATRYSAGLATTLTRSPRHRALSLRSQRLYKELAAAVPALPIRRLPLFFVTSETRRGELEVSVHGPRPEPARGEQIAALDRLCGGLALAGDDRVLAAGRVSQGDANGVVCRLVAHLRTSGRADCRERIEIREIHRGSGRLELVATDGGILAARRAIVATGPWILSGPGGRTAARHGIRTKKVVSLLLDRAPAPSSPAIYFFEAGAFLLPLEAEGRWLFSFRCETWDCLPEHGRLRISAEDRAAGLAILERYAPALVSEARGGRVFCDAYAPDGVPLAARDPDHPGLVLAAAGSGSGYRLAPGIADEALRALRRA